MSEQLFSSLSFEQLKMEISDDVFKKVAPLIQSVQQPQKETELLSRKQAAKMLGVSLPTILDWTKTGKITGYRIASRIRYKRNEIEDSLTQIKTRR
jgi:excisionase family DNA binding protein